MFNVAVLIAFSISDEVIEDASSKYFSIKASSDSATASNILSLHSLAVSFKSSGISTSLKVIPRSSSFQIIPFIVTRSTTPLKLSSEPIGICNGIGFPFNLSLTCSTHLKKSAPIRSILLTNPMRGTLYLSACLQTVSDCGSTPPEAQNNATAPSRTLNERSTSTVKST